MTIRIPTFCFAALTTLALVGCPTVEPTEPVDTDPATVVEDPALVGVWVSEGADIAPLLAGPPINAVRLDAEFRADGTYDVTSTDDQGTGTDFSGTYTVDESTDPATVVITQSVPAAATSEGIWMVEAGVLTYEVVQTSPDFGFVAPTPATGFGSTSGNGLPADVNIQVYR